ncbi:MAG: ribonuclease P protein component [Pirellulales bacterium]|nr:ribonuclease P protein component [Pirellulales bacterium]MBL7193816.1 ribonuclease P protein component [Pirellulales bacterium]
MPLLFRFSAAMRLSGQRAFSRVFAARKTAGNGSVVVHAAARPAEEPPRAGVPAVRLGLSVSRRVGSAVERNRWKRRLREAFRLSQHKLPAGYDFVVVVRGRVPPEVAELQAALRVLSEQAAFQSRRRPRSPHGRRRESR